MSRRAIVILLALVGIGFVVLRGHRSEEAAGTTSARTLPGERPHGHAVDTLARDEPTAKIERSLEVAKGRAVLVTGAAALGRVTDDHGHGVANAVVVAAPVSAWSARGERSHDVTTTARDGTFRFDALPAGAFQFRASHFELAPASSAPVTLDGKTARDGISIVMPAGATVRGTVVDDARRPLAGAHVRITVAPRFTANVAQLRTTVSDARGAFEVRGVANQPMLASALHTRGSSKQVPVDATSGDVTSVELVIDQPSAADRADTTQTPTRRRPRTDGHVSGAPDRALGGLVTANGQPVANATIYAGHSVVGTGSTTSRNDPRVVATTTDANGKFSLAGLTDGDIAVIAEEPSLGRSKAMRVPTAMPDQGDLVLELLPFGALSGTLTRNGAAAEGVTVTCQSTTTPNAIFTVASTSTGGFRFDKLAPDSYKVSATLGTQRTGLRLYSKQVVVVSGEEATVALAVEPGSITVEVTATARAGTLGAAGAWLVPGAVTATTATSLISSVAAGAGASQWQMIRQGAPAELTEVAPGDYTACVVPLPSTVHGVGSIAYLNAHADALPAFCQALTVSPAPLVQSVAVVVDIPH